MPNPYASTWTATSTLSNVRGQKDPHSREQVLESSDLSTWELLGRLLPYVRQRIVLLVLSFVCAGASVLLQLYVPILVGTGIDLMVAQGCVDFVGLAPLLKRLALTVACAAATQWVSLYCSNRAAYEVVQGLRDAAYDKFRTLSLGFVDTHSHGDLLSRVINDVDAMGDGLLQGFNQLFSGIVTIIGTLVFMGALSVPVMLVVAALTPLSIFVARRIASRSAASFSEQQRIQGELSGFAEEMISNQRLLSAFDRQGQAYDHFAQINSRLYAAGEHAQFISSLTNPSTRLVNNLCYAAVALFGCACVMGVLPFALTIGKVQSFLAYTNQYMKPFNEISSVVTQVQAAVASARRVFALLDATEEDPDPTGAKELTAARGALDLEHVFFSYDKRTTLLQDITLHVGAGQRFALVGPTGCGKTTLINLLLRFYDVDAGTVCVDGVDTRGLTRQSLRSTFGMVLQDTWLFEGTIADNIRYGSPDATDDQVIDAAKEAHAHKFIVQLPNGYDTVVGDGGDLLSQGQRQLLCIARVMLANPTILLLDEATSSIDTRTECQVQDAFDHMMEGRTSLVVAHRLSTVKNADCIVYMRGGRVIETGTHDELLATGGAYAELYRSQFAH